MPNWCSNNVFIDGSADAIAQLKKDIESISPDGFLFDSLVGRHPSVSQEDYDKEGWYDANVNYWGTKWDVDVREVEVYSDTTEITLDFLTAWSPPIEFCVELAKKYNVLVIITYEEAGSDIYGRTIVQKDGTQHVNDYDYNHGQYVLDSETFWANIYSDIDIEVRHKGRHIDEILNMDYPFLTEDERNRIINNK
jgi:hypothetical protein